MERVFIFLRLLKIPLDFGAVLFGFSLAYFFRADPDTYLWFLVDLPSGVLLPWDVYFPFMFQAGVLLVFYFAFACLYSFKKSFPFDREMVRVVGMLTAWLMTIIFYFFLVRISFFSRLVLGMGFLFSVVLIAFIRLVFRFVQFSFWKRNLGRKRVALLGSGEVVDQLVGEWKKDISIDLVGVIPIRKRLRSVLALKTLGEYCEYEKVLSVFRIDRLVQVERIGNLDAEIIEFCQHHHIEYCFVPDLLEVQKTNFDLDLVGDVPLITLRASRLDVWGRVIKRVFDFFVSSFLIILLSPVYAFFALLVKLDSKGPVFYMSQRVSRDVQFGMLKFRSMVVGADKMKEELQSLNKRSGPLFKVENDPRITRLGRFMRQWSIDELPQLFNVFLGDLNLVGPRAHLPEEVAEYEKHHRKVLVVKAGITGLAQISGRSHLDFEQEVKLDSFYVEHWSLWFDLWILWRTIWVVLKGEGE